MRSLFVYGSLIQGIAVSGAALDEAYLPLDNIGVIDPFILTGSAGPLVIFPQFIGSQTDNEGNAAAGGEFLPLAEGTLEGHSLVFETEVDLREDIVAVSGSTAPQPGIGIL